MTSITIKYKILNKEKKTLSLHCKLPIKSIWLCNPNIYLVFLRNSKSIKFY